MEMFQNFKEAIASYWRRSKSFRLLTTIVFLVLLVVPLFLLTWHTRVLFGYGISVLIIIVRMVFGYVARKNGCVEQFKKLSPRYYYYTRRVEFIVGGGLFTAFSIMLILSEIFGPLSSSHFFLLFLSLIIVGAVIGDKLGKKFVGY